MWFSVLFILIKFCFQLKDAERSLTPSAGRRWDDLFVLIRGRMQLKPIYLIFPKYSATKFEHRAAGSWLTAWFKLWRRWFQQLRVVHRTRTGPSPGGPSSSFRWTNICSKHLVVHTSVGICTHLCNKTAFWGKKILFKLKHLQDWETKTHFILNFKMFNKVLPIF